MTGGFGHMSCFSFYANKIITTGEGGMVLTNDAALAERLRLLRNLGFTKPRFRHEVAGFNFRMTGMQAAMGVAQVKRIEGIVEDKRRVAAAYNRALAAFDWLQLPAELEWARNVYWMYSVVVRPGVGAPPRRPAAATAPSGRRDAHVLCPMNAQPALQRLQGFREIPCPVADGLWERGFYLPSSTKLGAAEIETVAGALREAARAVRRGDCDEFLPRSSR